MYKLEIFKQVSFPIPVISVGNLTMGGSGKTPFSLFLAKEFEKFGIKSAIVLRGYKRRTKGVILVNERHTPEDVGEEAIVFKRNFAGPVVVAKKREQSLQILNPLPHIVILDDAFQHLKVKRDIDVVLVDSTKEDDLFPFPVGKLREPLSSIKSASIIVLTKGRKMPHKINRYCENIPLIFVDFEWEKLFQPLKLTIDELSNKKILILLGIGNPSHFVKMAEEKSLNIMDKIILPDHSYPDKKSVKMVLDSFINNRCDFILTSEKDFVKWSKISEIKEKLIYPILSLKIEDKEKILDKLISSILQK